MKTRTINGITLFFDATEQEAADLIGDASAKSARLIQKYWSLEMPRKCHVYVLTSWLYFVFHSASWPRRILGAITIPFWYNRVKKQWSSIGGWTLPYKHRPVIGVKPPRLFDITDKTIGQKIFIKEDDVHKKVQATVCHEMTHAFSSHLKLPLWLNEGIAMITVDLFFERPTVKPETIERLGALRHKTKPVEYRYLFRMNADDIAYQYIRGYWLTRYLEDRYPSLIKSLLSHRQSTKSLEQQIAKELGIQHRLFWREINDVVVSHFSNRETGKISTL